MQQKNTEISSVELLKVEFSACRQLSEDICSPLETEDYGLQAIIETSPVKWHLAHTSWFFETFVLKQFESSFSAYHPQYEHLFNSYYHGIGEQFPRAKRGLLSKPSVKEVYQYRRSVNQRVLKLLSSGLAQDIPEIAELTRLGINHEQQHQELIFTDLLYNWYQNPLLPSYQKLNEVKKFVPVELSWHAIQAGLCSIGHQAFSGFAFDNESPQHQVYIQDFLVANRLSTNGEYLAFIEAAGYQKPEFWLSDGWAKLQQEKWQAPLYWQKQHGQWYQYGLSGLQPLNLDEPVSHISAYEADAFARWSQARLLTEFEWELIAKNQAKEGGFLQSSNLKANVAKADPTVEILQLYGELWQWTSSAYQPYPGFKASKGAVGEYNGKFMCNQLVLRGGSCVTSRDHIRFSYRNFFYPEARWQFSGIRLAKDS